MGLPQGSVIAPILFSVMIHDIEKIVQQNGLAVNLSLYADHLALWADYQAPRTGLLQRLAQKAPRANMLGRSIYEGKRLPCQCGKDCPHGLYPPPLDTAESIHQTRSCADHTEQACEVHWRGPRPGSDMGSACPAPENQSFSWGGSDKAPLRGSVGSPPKAGSVLSTPLSARDSHMDVKPSSLRPLHTGSPSNG